MTMPELHVVPRSTAARWMPVAVTVALVGSTYYLRVALALVGLQALTFLIPTLFAAYFFGSRLATLASVLSFVMANALLSQLSPQLLFTRQYFGAMFTFAFLSGLVILYTFRHEQVLRRLDVSLAGEKMARAEAEQANRLKDQFLATLSHELRTPVNVMLGYLDMLLAGRTANPRRALEIVHRNAEQQARLIDDVLDASRIVNGTFRVATEPVTPVTIVRDVIESIQPTVSAKGLTLEFAARNQDAVILGDPQRLRQVFWNLLSNAVKFTPAGGRISVRAALSGSQVEIVVQDTGRGIAPEFLPHVFDMFRQGDASTTREVSGMGLGLTLVKRFVEFQNGHVKVESAGEGLGTTVTCRFPVHTSDDRTTATASVPLST